MPRRSILLRAHGAGLALTLACLCAGLALTAAAQGKKPITKRGLINAVKINGLTTRELVNEIETRGVDFEMTAADESEIRGVGARPEIIEAARANFRAPRPAATAASNAPARPTTPAATTSSAAGVPAGPPLSKNEVVTMLQGGISSARVEQFVEARGVSFPVTPEVAREITAAGGTRSLVGAITEKSVAANNNSAGDGNSNTSAGSAASSSAAGADTSGPDYDGLVDQAQSSFVAQDFQNAGKYLAQAIELDPSRPIGFQLLGSWALFAGDHATAEKAMRAAIERGGSATFRVVHDHDGNFQQYCEGSFFVSKAGVSFVANDGRDTFEAVDTNIKEVKTNRLVGANLGAFHVKPVQRINGRDNFNFAPVSTNKAEAQLLIRLVEAY